MPVTAESLIKKHEEGLANNVCIYDAWGVPFQVDPNVQSLVTIDHVHEEIHEGRSYVVTAVVPIPAGTRFQCIITADTLVPHMVMICAVAGNGATITLFEAPTFTGGTPVIPINRDRRSVNISTATFVHTPTVTLNGTQIMQFYLAAGKDSGSGDHGTDEWILKAGTSYLIDILCDAAQPLTFSGRMQWYEEAGPLA